MKIKMNKVLAMGMAALMTVSMLGGCGKDASNAPAENAAKEEAAENTAKQEGNGEELPTVKLVSICAVDPTDTVMVQEAISEITREKIGCNVEIIPVQIGNINTQMSLLLAGGDNMVDVYMAGGWTSLSEVAGNGQAIAIDEYIAPYEDKIKEVIGEEIYNCGKVNGKMYGVPKYLNFVGKTVYNLRKDIADQYGIENGSSMSFDELTDLFREIKQNYPDVALVGSCSTGFSSIPFATPHDGMGDMNNLGVVLEKDDDKVVNYYETEEYAQLIEYFKQWKEIGITMADPLNVVEQPGDYLASGKCLGTFGGHYDAELNAQWASENYGIEMIAVSLGEIGLMESPSMWACISASCPNPKEAAGLIALMATDADVENLLCNGIENVHYQILEDGSAAYLEGKDMTNAGWAMGMSWAQLNSTLAIPFEYPADMNERMRAANDAGVATKAFGIQIDNSNIANEISACSNVVAQYRAALEVGVPEDMDATYEAFKQALKDAGIDAIVEEKQRQLDEYIAQQ